MSSILENIAAELGPNAFAQIGSAIGANPAQTKSAVAAALPALLAGLARNTSSQEGAQSLANALERDHTPPLTSQFGALAGMLGGGDGGGALGGLGALAGMLGGGQQQSSSGLGDLLGAAVSMMGGQQAPAARPKALDGMGILGHILGNKQSNVEQGVAKASGLDLASIMKLLPVLAPILMSALGTMKKSKGLDAQGLASAIGQEREEISKQAGLASMLDIDNDGSMMDELASVGSMLAQSGVLGKLFS